MGHPLNLEHDPEKWKPVFRKDHAQATRMDRAAAKRISMVVLMRKIGNKQSLDPFSTG
ncbi:MAG TPA: hypothetical protein VGL45_15330 [Bradyrhizobium sp.]|jgi:hypothetical protein